QVLKPWKWRHANVLPCESLSSDTAITDEPKQLDRSCRRKVIQRWRPYRAEWLRVGVRQAMGEQSQAARLLAACLNHSLRALWSRPVTAIMFSSVTPSHSR